MTVSYASMLCLSTTHICISNWLLGRQAKLRLKESPPIHIPGWQLVYAVGGGVRSEPPKPLQVCAGGKPGQKRYTLDKRNIKRGSQPLHKCILPLILMIKTWVSVNNRAPSNTNLGLSGYQELGLKGYITITQTNI